MLSLKRDLLFPLFKVIKKRPRLDVVALQQAFASNSAYDLKNLGDAIVTMTIPQQPSESDSYNPPKQFTSYVTRYIKMRISCCVPVKTFRGFFAFEDLSQQIREFIADQLRIDCT